MDYQQLQPYSLLTRLSAAVHANDTSLARRILDEAIISNYDSGVIGSIMLGKRIARPEPLAPLNNGTNLDDCISQFGYHNGHPTQARLK